MGLALIQADEQILHDRRAQPESSLIDEACPDGKHVKITISGIPVADEIIAYASPDSTFAVTRALIEGAQSSIRIGIYDFTADHVRELLVAALARKVEVTLMLDFNNPDDERLLFESLRNAGAHCEPAPSCHGARHFPGLLPSRFPNAHEKFIIIDDLWTMVQSGNYSSSGIPNNPNDGVLDEHFKSGNREMGIAVKSAPLAAFFTELLKSDMALRLDQIDENVLPSVGGPIVLQKVLDARPPQLFKSLRRTLPQPVEITPVLSPDNYMDVVPPLLRRARRSISIEQQYIRNVNSPANSALLLLIEQIKAARVEHPDLRVRIIVAPPFENTQENNKKLESELDALESHGLRRGEHVRLLNKAHFKHCHNKLIVVDDQEALIGSQNWSQTAVAANREASLLIPDEAIASYFGRIFDQDWATAVSSAEGLDLADFFTLDTSPDGRGEDAVGALHSGRVAPVDWGDFADV